MRIVILTAIVVCIFAIIVLSIGLFHTFKQPKYKAIYGYCVAGSMILYIIMSGLGSIYEFFVNNSLYGLVLALCAISPFIIGKFVKYETLKKYTVFQILCFALSLAIFLIV